MAHILIMPRQGNTVESCIITGWKVKEGDEVTPETTACEVETDKASFEVPAGAAGTVLKLLFDSGDDVPVLKPIAVIGKPGEDWQVSLNSTEPSRSLEPKAGAEAQRPLDNAAGESAKDTSSSRDASFSISPRARKLAEKEALPMDTVSGTGPGGRIIERDVALALKSRPPLTAAVKAAGPVAVPREGSGLGGRVTVADMAASPLSAPHSPPSISQSQFPISQISNEGAITETPIKGIRKIIADRMHGSLMDSAQFTLNAFAPAKKLEEIRSGIKANEEFSQKLSLSKITINDLVLFAVSRILPQFPFMNAHKTGDTIKTFERVHLALAVDTPRGLMVPVIRNANLLPLARISSEAKRLAAACQNGNARADELSGSTFTVSNLGGLGVTSFTPVLNAPEVAILGVGCIEMKPVEREKDEAIGRPFSVDFEPHINFSLTINHQAVDGAPAARFLKALCETVAHIDLLLAAG